MSQVSRCSGITLRAGLSVVAAPRSLILWNPFVDTNPPPRFPAHELRFLKSLSPPSSREADPGVSTAVAGCFSLGRPSENFKTKQIKFWTTTPRRELNITNRKHQARIRRIEDEHTEIIYRSRSTAPTNVVLSRQQNVHGVWATATFRQKSSRRVGHSNISRLQDPAPRGQIHRSGRRPDSVGVSIKRTIISEGFSVPDTPGAIWAVFGTLRVRPGAGRFQEVHASDISTDVRTRERRRHEEGEEEQRQGHFLMTLLKSQNMNQPQDT